VIFQIGLGIAYDCLLMIQKFGVLLKNKDEKDQQELQTDLDEMMKWSIEWMLRFNPTSIQ